MNRDDEGSRHLLEIADAAMLRAVCPDRTAGILRFAQDDKQRTQTDGERAQHDMPKTLFNCFWHEFEGLAPHCNHTPAPRQEPPKPAWEPARPSVGARHGVPLRRARFFRSDLSIFARFSDDRLGEPLVNLIVARHWLRLLDGRVGVAIVPSAMPDQHTAYFFQLPDEVLSLHSATVNSSTLRTYGTSPDSRSTRRLLRLPTSYSFDIPWV